MVARVVWDHEAAGSSPVTSIPENHLETFVSGWSFCIIPHIYRAAYRYAPLLSSYSSICSSTLPRCKACAPVYVVLHNLIMEAIPCRVAPGRVFFCCLFPAKTL